jgi:hypothetical protein
MKSLPITIREIKATEKRLDAIYEAARSGLKGDSLAVAAGMLPAELRNLRAVDPMVDLMIAKGKSDSELEHASLLAQASRNGDAKASLAILQHLHGWTAQQSISVDITNKVSIIQALEEAKTRVIDGHSERIADE